MCQVTMTCRLSDVVRLYIDEVASAFSRIWPFRGSSRAAAREADTTITPGMATSALLLEVAHADGALSHAERRYIDAVLFREFGLRGAAAERLLRKAEKARRSSEASTFTHAMMGWLSEAQRARLSAIVRELALVHGDPDRNEEYAVRRISSLLDVEESHV